MGCKFSSVSFKIYRQRSLKRLLIPEYKFLNFKKVLLCPIRNPKHSSSDSTFYDLQISFHILLIPQISPDTRRISKNIFFLESPSSCVSLFLTDYAENKMIIISGKLNHLKSNQESFREDWQSSPSNSYNSPYGNKVSEFSSPRNKPKHFLIFQYWFLEESHY